MNKYFKEQHKKLYDDLIKSFNKKELADKLATEILKRDFD